jgi:hypothetical protein
MVKGGIKFNSPQVLYPQKIDIDTGRLTRYDINT